MDTSFYVEITSDFASSMKGKESTITPNSFFGYATTNSGQAVCSINSVNDFPNEFSAIVPLSVVSLSTSDFPITPPIQ